MLNIPGDFRFVNGTTCPKIGQNRTNAPYTRTKKDKSGQQKKATSFSRDGLNNIKLTP